MFPPHVEYRATCHQVFRRLLRPLEFLLQREGTLARPRG